MTSGRALSSPLVPAPLVLGTEWIVDAHGCDADSLRSRSVLQKVFATVVEQMGLHPMSDAVWHVFPGEAGITGVLLLSESHLTCHTFPEHRFAAFNLYSCRPAQPWPWDERLKQALAATRVSVRSFTRGDLDRE